MTQKKRIIPQNNLVIGENEKRNKIYIQEENRLKHLMFIGQKGSGKSRGVLPMLVQQDFEDKQVGSTIVAGHKETALQLYSLARREKRDVVLVKPSLTDIGKLLLQMNSYSYADIQREVVDFEKAIVKKQVVIIDMEFAKHRADAIRATAFLMSALQEAAVQVNEMKETRHYLYVDDAHLYLPGLRGLLSTGKEYGIGCTLLLDSREQCMRTEDHLLLDSAVRSTVLLSGITLLDAMHYVEDIYEKKMPFMRNRGTLEFIYVTNDKEGRRTSGAGKLRFLPEDVNHSLHQAIPQHRARIIREQVGVADAPLSSVSSATAPLPQPTAAPISLPLKPATPTRPLDIQSRREQEKITSHANRYVISTDDLFDVDEY